MTRCVPAEAGPLSRRTRFPSASCTCSTMDGASSVSSARKSSQLGYWTLPPSSSVSFSAFCASLAFYHATRTRRRFMPSMLSRRWHIFPPKKPIFEGWATCASGEWSSYQFRRDLDAPPSLPPHPLPTPRTPSPSQFALPIFPKATPPLTPSPLTTPPQRGERPTTAHTPIPTRIPAPIPTLTHLLTHLLTHSLRLGPCSTS